MIEIKNNTECCGCSACEQICPKQCISLQPDNEGYWYPEVKMETCIDCHLCEKVCPVLNPQSERTPLHTYAAINKDEQIRAQSASGGMFTLLAERVLKEDGVVFGVRFDEEWNVVFSYTETIEGLAPFRGSKYVQAWVGNSFKQVKKFLDEGRKVLFSGVPCQIAGLKQFLRKEYENLLTVDLICEGVPSPKLWKRYLDEEVARSIKKMISSPSNHSISKENILIKDISFRNKTNGWKKFSFSLTLANVSIDSERNSVLPLTIIDRNSAYMQIMFRYANLRPICYECPFKSCKSHSDITIADYWGITELHPEMDDDKGTSMVHVNTEKGKAYFDLTRVHYLETPYEEAWSFNNIVTSSKKHPKRDYFYAHAFNKKNLIRFMNAINHPMSIRIKEKIKITLKKVLPLGMYDFLKKNVWKRIKRK